MSTANPAAQSIPTAALKKLPPLVLHPFSDSSGPSRLIESSRASMMLQGLLPSGDMDRTALDRALLQGRYQEIRMLFYVGRDVSRWIEQCMEFVERQAELRGSGIRPQSFAALLVENPPAAVEAKLRKWGVGDFRSIFSRALGLNAILAQVPPREILNDDFIRNYFRYADQMFQCWQSQTTFANLRDFALDFDIFASGEYSRMLEREWS
jgi:hypothetical protein